MKIGNLGSGRFEFDYAGVGLTKVQFGNFICGGFVKVLG